MSISHLEDHQKISAIHKEISCFQELLHQLVAQHNSFSHPAVIEVSQELDKIIIIAQKSRLLLSNQQVRLKHV